uniref:PI3K/PI4K catalytic domain-containing protein n=1 Tax=Phaeomonas parva TaxID=124430 RepID=A0A7S1UDQ2_9STRA|mmetsp:Transcript_43511/g.136482  ORF Transcript_43511/g.136482 Transcript_43511/m.136482 type:complete len:957 (+) Transcript_43511:343-3213(+)
MGQTPSAENEETEFHVETLFTSTGALDMREVTLVLWKNRENANLVQVLTEMMGKFSDEKTVFDAMEFYLPQLAHMLIHMEHDLPSSALENFALIACQQSIHLALQLEWIVTGALEDYAPEDPLGEANPNFNARYFRRCAKLLQDIERCVVYGNFQNPTLEDMYRRGYVNKKEFSELEIADRRYAAIQLSSAKSAKRTDVRGDLWCKRGDPEREEERTRRKHKWMLRSFEIRDRMLFCYRKDKKHSLKRAVNLDNAEVKIVHNDEFPYYFELRADTGGTTVTYYLHAETKQEMDGWVTALNQWSGAPPQPGEGLAQEEEDDEKKVDDDGAGDAPEFKAAEAADTPPEHERRESQVDRYLHTFKLTPEQAARYAFYHQQRGFVRALTNICEDLRFVEVPKRDGLLVEALKTVVIPDPCYLPLCKSSDAWARVLRITPGDHHAFSTRARCPCLVTFEVALEEDFVDVANFLHQRFGAPAFLEGMEDATVATTPSGAEEPDGLTGVIGDAINLGAETLTSIGTIMGINNGTPPVPEKEDKVPPLPPTPQTTPVVAEHHGSGPSPKSNTRRVSRPDVWRNVRRSPDESARWSLDLKQLAKKVRGVRRRRRSDRSGRSSGGSDLERESSMRLPEDSFDVLAGTTEVWRRDSRQPGDELADDIRARALARTCYGEAASEKRSRIFQESPFKDTPGWDLVSVIFKSNDDLRQEVFVMQLITFYRAAWMSARCNIWIFTYRILSTSQNTGAIQVVPNAISLDGLKKSEAYPGTLLGHFQETYGSSPEALATARSAFAHSLAGYSLLQYLLLIKDRHNGNILLDAVGHIVHIDFGFVFGIAPGKAFSMELSCPWKLTPEYVEVLGEPDDPVFQEYRQALIDGLKVARRHADTVECLTEIMAFRSRFPCFEYSGSVAPLRKFRQRLRLDISDDEVPALVDSLIYKSMHHKGTIWYDKFQTWSNGIAQ